MINFLGYVRFDTLPHDSVASKIENLLKEYNKTVKIMRELKLFKNHLNKSIVPMFKHQTELNYFEKIIIKLIINILKLFY